MNSSELLKLKEENNRLSEENRKLKIDNLKLRKENLDLRKENKTLKREVKRLSTALFAAESRIKSLETKYDNYVKSVESLIEKTVSDAVNRVTAELNKAHKKEVDELQAKINRLEKRLNTDSSNSGIPTSKDKIGNHKVQNNREKTDKQIGGQKGHVQHKLEYFKEDEITETVEHTLDKCPNCGGKLTEVNIVKSDVIDIEIIITKTRNNIHNYKCNCCKKNVSANDKLPRGVIYGDNLNAICLSMMNEANTPLNKVTSLLSGMTNGEINISEGYLSKIQNKCSKNLDTFIHDLKEKVISLKHVFWDDTTIKFGLSKPIEGYDDEDSKYLNNLDNKDKKIRNGIIRFYGDDNWALLIGHRRKNSEGIDDDGILDNLSKDCVVMHDHVLLNYNDKYSFQNAECNEHTKRYLKGILDMFPEHNWAKEMRELLITTNKEKNELILADIHNFSDEKLAYISKKYDEYIKLGYTQNATVNISNFLNKNDELNLIERLEKFKDNHLLFARDFNVAFTNNTSEKGLRQVKRKIAVSFMFKNANRMKDYAQILSYLETCHRNGISRYEASKRLVSNNPITIEELSNISNIQKGEKN